MLRIEAERAISMALEFCAGKSCVSCFKSESCVSIFGSHFVDEEVLRLAEKCQEFNYAKYDEEM